MSENTPYIVSARKYRPATFATVVGQKALTNTLKSAIDNDRVAQAYLFCGPRGVGKTSCARIFARTLNCQHPTADGEACGECDSCRAILEGNSFNIIELDAASNNSVNDMRQLCEQVSIPPRDGRYRVFIIDEVHMLSPAAFNAFLKTLEEPPKYVVFILATTEKHKVIPTILSRCQIYDFKRITIPDMVEHLKYVASQEGIEAEGPALEVIAQKADGAMRDALSIFDQVAASTAGHITFQATLDNLNVLDYSYYFRLVEAFLAGDVQTALVLYNEIREKGFDSKFFINGLGMHVRNLMVAKDPATLHLLEVGDEASAQYKAQGSTVPFEWTFTALRLLNDADLNYQYATNKQLLTELLLIRLCGQGKLPEKMAPLPQVQPLQSAPAAPQQPAPQPAPQPVPQPVAQPAPQPVQQPAPAPASVAQPKRAARPGRPSTFRLDEETPAAEEPGAPAGQPEAVPQAEVPAAAAFTDEQLANAWREYAEAHPAKHILVNSMLSTLPKRSGTGLTAQVATPTEQQAFETDLADLVEHLRTRLGAPGLTLHVELSEEDPDKVSRRLLPAEFLHKAMKENPQLGALLTGLEAEMIG